MAKEQTGKEKVRRRRVLPKAKVKNAGTLTSRLKKKLVDELRRSSGEDFTVGDLDRLLKGDLGKPRSPKKKKPRKK